MLGLGNLGTSGFHLTQSDRELAPRLRFLSSNVLRSKPVHDFYMVTQSEQELLVTADLHYGARAVGDRAVEALADHVRKSEASALVIAGDIATSPAAIERCLELFDGFRGFKAALPGNHDLWTSPDGPGSWELHEHILPEIFERHGFHPLHLRPATVDRVALVGTMGWYDYSFRDDIGIPLDAYRTKIYPGEPFPLWRDADKARLSLEDEELTRLLADRLEEALGSLAKGSRAVGVMHHLATRKLLVHPRAVVPRRWRFANAFLGSEVFSRVFARHQSVRQIFCGHAHYNRAYHTGTQRYAVIGSTYLKKQLVRTTSDRIEERLTFG